MKRGGVDSFKESKNFAWRARASMLFPARLATTEGTWRTVDDDETCG